MTTISTKKHDSVVPTGFAFEYADVVDTLDPISHRRARLVERLMEQAKLAIDPKANVRTLTRNNGKGDARQVVEIKQIIRPTFRPANGKILFWTKVGSGKLELAPSKFAVVVPDLKTVPALVEALIERIDSGEFDAQLSKRRVIKKKKDNTESVPPAVKEAIAAEKKRRRAA
jgi:hypothetical protein